MHATDAVADISSWSDRDQLANRGGEEKRDSVLHPRALAGIPPRRARRTDVPDVHEPDDREWDGEAEGDRAGFRRADGNGQEIYKGIPESGKQRILRGPGAAQFGVGVKGRSVGAGAEATGRRAERAGDWETTADPAQHVT